MVRILQTFLYPASRGFRIWQRGSSETILYTAVWTRCQWWSQTWQFAPVTLYVSRLALKICLVFLSQIGGEGRGGGVVTLVAGKKVSHYCVKACDTSDHWSDCKNSYTAHSQKLLSWMSDNVFFEVTSYGAGKVALCANKRSFSWMCELVHLEVLILSTRIVALLTPQRLFSGMDEHVHL